MNKDLNYYLSLEYPAEIRHFAEGDGGGYQATIPMLGRGSFVGHGDTPEEAYENLQECKKEIFEELLADGVEILEPSTEDIDEYSGKFVARIPKELHRDLVEAAKLSGTSLNQYIVYALTKFKYSNTRVQ
jgi:antitoxin HicB